MSVPVYPESAAIIFAVDRRVFVTPEIADPFVGEKSLIRAAKDRYMLHEQELVRYTSSLCEAFLVANPKSREFNHPSLDTPIEPGQVAFLTSVDRVILVDETAERAQMTTFNRFLGATLFMNSQGPLPLLDALQCNMKTTEVGLHRIWLPDGSARLARTEDLEAIRELAAELRDKAPDGSYMRCRLERLCDDIKMVLKGSDEPDANVVSGPWGR
jgi:hypothetical protein